MRGPDSATSVSEPFTRDVARQRRATNAARELAHRIRIGRDGRYVLALRADRLERRGEFHALLAREDREVGDLRGRGHDVAERANPLRRLAEFHEEPSAGQG